MEVDIAFAMTGDVRRNTRALRQLGALSAAGYRVTVFSLPGRSGSGAPTPAIGGVRIVDVPVPPGRGIGYFRAVHRAYSRAVAGLDARLYHASDLYVLHAARNAARTRKRPYSYDARELYAHVAATVGRPAVRACWRLAEWRAIRGCSRVWTVSEGIADRLSAMHGIRRPAVQLNAPALQDVEPDDFLRRATGTPSDAPVILHLGQLRPDRGCTVLVRAMLAVEGAHLVFLGSGPEEESVKALSRSLGVSDRVHVVPPVAPDRIAAVTAGADVGVTLLEGTCLNHRLALPNKLFDYLAAGLPTLVSDLDETGRLLALYRFGASADPNREESVASALNALAFDASRRPEWRRNARTAAETFDWRTASQRFIADVRDLIGDPAVPNA